MARAWVQPKRYDLRVGERVVRSMSGTIFDGDVYVVTEATDHNRRVGVRRVVKSGTPVVDRSWSHGFNTDAAEFKPETPDPIPDPVDETVEIVLTYRIQAYSREEFDYRKRNLLSDAREGSVYRSMHGGLSEVELVKVNGKKV